MLLKGFLPCYELLCKAKPTLTHPVNLFYKSRFLYPGFIWSEFPMGIPSSPKVLCSLCPDPSVLHFAVWICLHEAAAIFSWEPPSCPGQLVWAFFGEVFGAHSKASTCKDTHSNYPLAQLGCTRVFPPDPLWIDTGTNVDVPWANKSWLQAWCQAVLKVNGPSARPACVWPGSTRSASALVDLVLQCFYLKLKADFFPHQESRNFFPDGGWQSQHLRQGQCLQFHSKKAKGEAYVHQPLAHPFFHAHPRKHCSGFLAMLGICTGVFSYQTHLYAFGGHEEIWTESWPKPPPETHTERMSRRC